MLSRYAKRKRTSRGTRESARRGERRCGEAIAIAPFVGVRNCINARRAFARARAITYDRIALRQSSAAPAAFGIDGWGSLTTRGWPRMPEAVDGDVASKFERIYRAHSPTGGNLVRSHCWPRYCDLANCSYVLRGIHVRIRIRIPPPPSRHRPPELFALAMLNRCGAAS